MIKRRFPGSFPSAQNFASSKYAAETHKHSGKAAIARHMGISHATVTPDHQG